MAYHAGLHGCGVWWRSWSRAAQDPGTLQLGHTRSQYLIARLHSMHQNYLHSSMFIISEAQFHEER